MLTTGTAVIVPRARRVELAHDLVTAAIEEYSQPWTPPIRLRRGPSRAPVRSKAGTATPLSVIVVRTAAFNTVPAYRKRPLPAALTGGVLLIAD